MLHVPCYDKTLLPMCKKMNKSISPITNKFLYFWSRYDASQHNNFKQD